ncbi:MAG TPA: MotA/TolQ/ExbB proton channel family protein [Bryobacteraceae bacterium]|jgi:biopolymer transport protein TolQ|nr:MotA/TolQ/ExbB proton channel family protein [Bryobacteraceae bacterium]
MRYDIEAAKLASDRAAAVVHWKMGRGRASLAAIASSATFIGLFGTLVGILTSFRGVNGEKSTLMAALTEYISEAIVSTAAGFLVAIVAYYCHRYLCTHLEVLDTEMRTASLELANALSILRQRD